MRIDPYVEELTALRAEMIGAAHAHRTTLASVHPDRRASAGNLLHYLALRRHDVRALQLGLASLGLSSLGRAEPHVLATTNAVLTALHALNGGRWMSEEDAVVDFEAGDRILLQQTERLLGPAPQDRSVRIMVTMPTEAADDYAIVHDLVQQGMNCMRINCAHGDRTQWLRMIEHLRRAETALKRRCQIVMDVAGAKLRTGPVAAGPAVIKVRPTRDQFGHVIAPARIWLTDRDAPQLPPAVADAILPVDGAWLALSTIGSCFKFRDARGARRRLTIVDVASAGVWAELTKTAYFVPGTTLRRADAACCTAVESQTTVGDLPSLDWGLKLDEGDILLVARELDLGQPERRDALGHVLVPASIGCSLPQILDEVRAGEPIWFDDGRFGGVIERVDQDRVRVRITHAPAGGGRLSGDKGINLPDSHLHVPALTAKDLDDLTFIVQHADIVALSFANGAADVEALQQKIAALGPRRPAIMLKIETKRGFEHLPEMLLAAMRMPCCGVMIARGDLAVECGFERLAEVQEEILWICQAAHVPVVWATQVLEGLAKTGTASRAEITDAAMGHRAECVMLNKGPHIVTAVRTLDDILKRMQAHQAKKRSMLRELRLAHALVAERNELSAV